MAQKIRIKDVAELAGVSAGTVDRVIHNRGNVSKHNREAVEKALQQMNYHTNLHVSAISLRKTYKVVIAIPQYNAGEYWEAVVTGITCALNRYSGLNVTCEYKHYNQFDLYSCRSAYDEILSLQPDAAIIGATFRDEAFFLANQLTDAGIPFLFIDSMVEGTSPLAYFIADPFTCGYLMAKLITMAIGPDAGIAIMQAVRVGDESANITIDRKAGFMKYYEEQKLHNPLVRIPFSALHPERNEELIGDIFQRNPDIRGIVVLSSRGYVIADYLRRHDIRHTKLIGIDILPRNIDALQTGHIEFLIGQRPEQQGFLAMQTLFKYLIYKEQPRVRNLMPIDIITKENVEMYTEFQHTGDEG